MAPVRDIGWFNKGHADDPTSISPIRRILLFGGFPDSRAATTVAHSNAILTTVNRAMDLVDAGITYRAAYTLTLNIVSNSSPFNSTIWQNCVHPP
jgi:hypothetical protein